MSFRLLITFLLLLSSFGYGSTSEPLSLLDQHIYKSVTAICKMNWYEYNKYMFTRTLDKSWVAMNDFNQVVFTADGTKLHKVVIKDKGLSSELATMLDSKGFYLAVQNCFPNDEKILVDFVRELILSDNMARIIGTVGSVYIVFKSAKLIQGIFEKSYQVFSLSRWGKNLDISRKAFHVSAMAATVTTAYISYELLGLFKSYRQKIEKDATEIKELKYYIGLAKNGILEKQQAKSQARSNAEACSMIRDEKEMAGHMISFIKKLEELDKDAAEADEIKEAELIAISTYRSVCS